MPDLFISQHPLVRDRLRRLRARETPPSAFRCLVRELSLLLGVEATRDLTLQPRAVHTPMGPCAGQELAEQVILVPVLRAGLGMAEGLSQLLPEAEIWHLGLYRDERTLDPVEYFALPERNGDRCLVLDPMLATGGSAVAAIDRLGQRGLRGIRFLGLIGSPEGVRRLHAAHPEVPIHLCALDEGLDERGFIVPGLGDAGDRQFATL